MPGKNQDNLPEFHPLTLIRDWGNGQGFRLEDALTGVCVFGATGSGKTSGPAKHLAMGYLSHDFGGLVLCAKKEERRQWEEWAAATGRTNDLVIIDKSARWRFNCLDWEASRPGEGGGLTINIVALLDEIAGTIAGSAGKAEGGSGDNKFFEDALHLLNTNLVDLPILAGYPVSLPLMREIVNSAPQTLKDVTDEEWQESSICAAILREADAATRKGDPAAREDFEECQAYWLQEFPALSEKTRSIVTLSFSMLVRPFLTRPLRKLFSADTNITPEAMFDGRIIIVDLPVQEFKLAGKVANHLWKYATQIAILRRSKPVNGYLRPVFIYADEYQNFISDFDSEFQAVARSAGGCSLVMCQNRESLRRVLGDTDAVDSLLGNLQAKFFCQNSGDTNEWAAKLLGERYIGIVGTNMGRGEEGGSSSGISRNEQRRFFIEPATFTTLKRGGPKNNYQVEAIVYNGGHQFPTAIDGSQTFLPYKLLTFNQK